MSSVTTRLLLTKFPPFPHWMAENSRIPIPTGSNQQQCTSMMTAMEERVKDERAKVVEDLKVKVKRFLNSRKGRVV